MAETKDMVDVLEVNIRDNLGKGASREMRRSDKMVPGIVYGADKDNQPIAIDPRHIMRGLRSGHFFSKVYTLQANGKSLGKVLTKDVQFHPVTDAPIHIDFMRVSEKTRVAVMIPIHFTNDDKCPGVKMGGMLNVVHHGIEVKCSPLHAPEEIECDLSSLDIGGSIRISDLKLPSSLQVLGGDENTVIVNIAGSSSSAQDAEGGEGEEE